MILNRKPSAAKNHMAKYADDATLLVPEITSLSIEVEFRFVQKWACDNKLSVNLSKTKEIVFHRPNLRSILVSSPLQNIERVTSTKLLGVYISHDLATNAQTEYVLKICNQRLYLLNQLKRKVCHVSSWSKFLSLLFISYNLCCCSLVEFYVNC